MSYFLWKKYDNVLSKEMRKCPNQKIFVLLNDIIKTSFKYKGGQYEKGGTLIERKSKISNY